MSYKIKTEYFEGPFELLVYLIENAQMSIYDIKISEITKQYVSYIEKLQKKDVTVAAEFFYLAAVLIELKSKMLLPGEKKESENIIEEDPRTELVNRILEYKKCKRYAEMLSEREEEMAKIFEKPCEDISEYAGEPEEHLNIDLDKLIVSFRLLIQKKAKEKEIRKRYEKTSVPRKTTEEKITYINSFMKDKKTESVSFSSLLEGTTDNYEKAVTFVSMLELVKERTLEAEQKVLFGDITVKNSTPITEQ